ncbi:MAG: 30S ribosomal protein S12 methylthiotransferase RimO [Pseudomonadota bacterium]
MKKKIYLVSLGCPKNLVDSEMLLHTAANEGWEIVGDSREADLLVVNTCGFIEDARQESLECIRGCLDIKEAAGTKDAVEVVVAGCMARMPAALAESDLRRIDHIVGLGELGAFRRIVSRAGRRAGGRPKRSVLFPGPSTPRLVTGFGHSTYVKIGDGCSRKCSFCLIPSIRGRGVSAGPRKILGEVRDLASFGVREIVLVSQDTTAYGADLAGRGAALVELLKNIVKVEGIEWIRIMYLYPHRSLHGLFDFMRENRKVVPYIDMPVQHGSDRMLRLMRRGHGTRLLDDLIGRARERVPGIAIRTTLLVGHPGEDEESFEQLLGFMRRHRFERIGIMKYSDEKRTKAFSMREKVPPRIAEDRCERAVDAASRILRSHQRKMVGRTAEVMLDEKDAPSRSSRQVRGGSGTWYGRLATQAPEVDGGVIVKAVASGHRSGDIIRVRITKVSGIDLEGEASAHTR